MVFTHWLELAWYSCVPHSKPSSPPSPLFKIDFGVRLLSSFHAARFYLAWDDLGQQGWAIFCEVQEVTVPSNKGGHTFLKHLTHCLLLGPPYAPFSLEEKSFSKRSKAKYAEKIRLAIQLPAAGELLIGWLVWGLISLFLSSNCRSPLPHKSCRRTGVWRTTQVSVAIFGAWKPWSRDPGTIPGIDTLTHWAR